MRFLSAAGQHAPASIRKRIRRFMEYMSLPSKVRHRPIRDERSSGVDAADLIHTIGEEAVLMNVSLERFRCFSAVSFPCAKDSAHPFIMAIHSCISAGCEGAGDAILRAYHQAWQPQTIAELVGVDPGHAGRRLLEPPDGSATMGSRQSFALLPWYVGPRTSDWARLKARSRSADHTKSLNKLVSGIQQTGYVRNDGIDGDIAGYILLDGKNWAVVLTRGRHRSAALGALGYDSAPVRINCDRAPVSVVTRSSVEDWPHVRSGIYTVDQGLAVFDRMLAGEQPPALRWPQPPAPNGC